MASTKLWMRRIKIELSSEITKKALQFGDNENDNLTISIEGNKFPSALQDNGTVTIMNLSYATITQIILGKYYKIKIWIGYHGLNGEGFFYPIVDGSVSYISKKIRSNHDTETYIMFASDLVAKYSQNRMNFQLNSGINLYAAINYMLFTQGISNAHLSPDLKNQFLNEVLTNYGTTGTVIEGIVNNQTGKYVFSTDNTEGTVVNVTSINDKRVIRLDKEKIPLIDGNPTLSSDGLIIKLLPTANFKVGDIIQIDNGIIDFSISNSSGVQNTFNENYLDTNGQYMIMEIKYKFTNRGNDFYYQLKARALDFIGKISTK